MQWNHGVSSENVLGATSLWNVVSGAVTLGAMPPHLISGTALAFES